MIISLISAIGKNNELGLNNQLLWDMPIDMKHFRDTTRGHTVIMGRKTFESLPNGPLPKRQNIIITRDKNYQREGVVVVNSIQEALQFVTGEFGKGFEENQEEVEVFIIGGAEIYKQSIPLADKLYITHIDGSFVADTFFPEINLNVWQKISEEKHSKDETNKYDCSFVVYDKIK